MIVILILLTLFQLYLTFLVGYLLLLTAASWKKARSPDPTLAGYDHRFLILVPAHNEERLLPGLLESLARLDYPKDRFSVHVVADNCTDQTAAVVEQHGLAHLHRRSDLAHQGKGCALNWLMARLYQAGEPFDALVFLDADSVVSSNFLRVMSAHLARGEKAIQAYYAVRDPDLSWAGSLRYAALAVLHFLRPQGRMALGCSAGLKGNGMVFSGDLIRRQRWSASLTEDIELHMALLLAGERVTFAQDAVVWGEMPDTLRHATSQNLRWEQGRKQMAGKYIPRLLAAAGEAFRRGRFRQGAVLADAVMEFIEPPFSILAGLTLLGLLMSLAVLAARYVADGSPDRLAAFNSLLAVMLLLGQGVYLFTGLRSVSAPRQVYQNLLYVPRLMIWKTWLMIRVLLGGDQNTWVRTKRNG